MSNAQRIWYGQALNQHSERKIYEALQQNGQRLPCSVVSAQGSIVTVKFEVLSKFTLPQIQVPVVAPEYIRYPIQPGDKGYLSDATARLGAITGLGGGTPDLSQPSNLGALVFFPLGNKHWFPVDPDVLTMYGPNGVTLYDEGQNSTFVLTPTGITVTGKTQVQVKVGSSSITITSSGVAIQGPLTINGQPYLLHVHTGVQTGSGDTGPVL